MIRQNLQWWLWVWTSVAIMIVAGVFGFYGLLLVNDLTYIGFGIIAIYIGSTGAMWHKVRTNDTSYDFMWFIAEVMEKLGSVGMIIGLIIAFSSLFDNIDLNNLDQTKKLVLMVGAGITTKLYATFVGLVCSVFLKMQISILEKNNGKTD